MDMTPSTTPSSPHAASEEAAYPPLISDMLEEGCWHAGRPRHDGWTPERLRTFLETLAACGVVADACRAAEVDLTLMGEGGRERDHGVPQQTQAQGQSAKVRGELVLHDEEGGRSQRVGSACRRRRNLPSNARPARHRRADDGSGTARAGAPS